MSQPFLPFFVPEIGDAEIDAVVEVLRSGWLTTGPKSKEFERRFAERLGVRHAIAVNSATSALHLALDAAGIGPGDEVLVPTLTFASTAEVVLHVGAKPVLVDCQPDTLASDRADFERAITPRTRALMPMHYAGQPCEMAAIRELAQVRGLALIEDAAHALPASYRGEPIGAHGNLCCFSFYANKPITTGEGGMLVTNDDAQAERARIMSLHGISKDAWRRFSAEGSWYYEILAPGFKYNLTDTAAALGLVQLDRCDELQRRRQALADQYDEVLGSLPLRRPARRPEVQHAWHLYVVQLEVEQLTIDRNQVIEGLKQRGIGTSVHYMPLHMHPYYRDQFGYQPGDLPVAADAYRRMISLPLFPRMSEADVRRVAAALTEILTESRR